LGALISQAGKTAARNSEQSIPTTGIKSPAKPAPQTDPPVTAVEAATPLAPVPIVWKRLQGPAVPQSAPRPSRRAALGGQTKREPSPGLNGAKPVKKQPAPKGRSRKSAPANLGRVDEEDEWAVPPEPEPTTDLEVPKLMSGGAAPSTVKSRKELYDFVPDNDEAEGTPVPAKGKRGKKQVRALDVAVRLIENSRLFRFSRSEHRSQSLWFLHRLLLPNGHRNPSSKQLPQPLRAPDYRTPTFSQSTKSPRPQPTLAPLTMTRTRTLIQRRTTISGIS
jgi:hypothetical protein